MVVSRVPVGFLFANIGPDTCNRRSLDKNGKRQVSGLLFIQEETIMAILMIPDDIVSHPKVAKIGPRAAWLHLCAVSYCIRYRTDKVHKWMVSRLADFDDSELDDCIQLLFGSELWAKNGDYYMIRDWLGIEGE